MMIITEIFKKIINKLIKNKPETKCFACGKYFNMKMPIDHAIIRNHGLIQSILFHDQNPCNLLREQQILLRYTGDKIYEEKKIVFHSNYRSEVKIDENHVITVTSGEQKLEEPTVEELALIFHCWKFLSIIYESTTTYDVRYNSELNTIIGMNTNENTESLESEPGEIWCSLCMDKIENEMTHFQINHSSIFDLTCWRINFLDYKLVSELPPDLLLSFYKTFEDNIKLKDHRIEYLDLDISDKTEDIVDNNIQPGDVYGETFQNNAIANIYYCVQHDCDIPSLETVNLHLFIEHQREIKNPQESESNSDEYGQNDESIPNETDLLPIIAVHEPPITEFPKCPNTLEIASKDEFVVLIHEYDTRDGYYVEHEFFVVQIF